MSIKQFSDSLRPSDYKILKLILEGLSNKEIASSLYLSIRTVETSINKTILPGCKAYLNVDTIKRLIVHYYQNKSEYDQHLEKFKNTKPMSRVTNNVKT